MGHGSHEIVALLLDQFTILSDRHRLTRNDEQDHCRRRVLEDACRLAQLNQRHEEQRDDCCVRDG